MLYFIDQRLNQGSGKMDESFGGFGITFVGDFQKLPPIGDIPIYDEDTSDSYVIYSDIQYVVVLHKSQQQQGDDPLQGAFRSIIYLYIETETQGGLLQEDWDVFKTKFIQNDTDARNERWNDAPYMFHDKKSCFKYNLIK